MEAHNVLHETLMNQATAFTNRGSMTTEKP